MGANTILLNNRDASSIQVNNSYVRYGVIAIPIYQIYLFLLLLFFIKSSSSLFLSIPSPYFYHIYIYLSYRSYIELAPVVPQPE